MRSAWLGSGSPEGWLCIKITAAALCSSAILTTSRGYTLAPSNIPGVFLPSKLIQRDGGDDRPEIVEIDEVCLLTIRASDQQLLFFPNRFQTNEAVSR